jgi:hypothetical protein
VLLAIDHLSLLWGFFFLAQPTDPSQILDVHRTVKGIGSATAQYDFTCLDSCVARLGLEFDGVFMLSLLQTSCFSSDIFFWIKYLVLCS